MILEWYRLSLATNVNHPSAGRITVFWLCKPEHFPIQTCSTQQEMCMCIRLLLTNCKYSVSLSRRVAPGYSNQLVILLSLWFVWWGVGSSWISLSLQITEVLLLFHFFDSPSDVSFLPVYCQLHGNKPTCWECFKQWAASFTRCPNRTLHGLLYSGTSTVSPLHFRFNQFWNWNSPIQLIWIKFQLIQGCVKGCISLLVIYVSKPSKKTQNNRPIYPLNAETKERTTNKPSPSKYLIKLQSFTDLFVKKRERKGSKAGHFSGGQLSRLSLPEQTQKPDDWLSNRISPPVFFGP